MTKPRRRSIRAFGFKDNFRRKGILGSDQRVRGGHPGRCILCGIQKTLCLSHVIPKWAYKWHKAAYGGTVHALIMSQDMQTIDQDGEKHYLMCRDCEIRASKAEAYVYALTNGTLLERKSFGIVKSWRNSFHGFDFSLTAQFIASIALRAHYAPSLIFSKIHLPRSYRGFLRRMIFRKASDSSIPWFMGVRFRPPKKQLDHDPREDLFIEFITNEFAGEIFTVFVGGWEWYAAFSTDTDLAKAVYRRRLRDVKKAVFPPASYDIHRSIAHLYKDGKLMK